MAAAPGSPIVAMTTVVWVVPFDAANDLHLLIDRFGAAKTGERWTRNGVRVRLRLPASSRAEFAATLLDNTRGAGRCEAASGAAY